MNSEMAVAKKTGSARVWATKYIAMAEAIGVKTTTSPGIRMRT